MNSDIEKKKQSEIKNSTESWLQKVEQVTGKRLSPATPALGVVYLLLDVSVSMEGKKLSDAIEGAVGFAEDAVKKGYAVGVIRFSERTESVFKASRDVAALATAVRRLTIDSGTLISPPLLLAHEKLASVRLKRVAVLFTDGEAQDQSDALRAADRLKKDGIDIIAIGTEDADSEFLRLIASRRDLAVATTTRQIASAIRKSAGLLGS